jgi:hypothetical protein
LTLQDFPFGQMRGDFASRFQRYNWNPMRTMKLSEFQM